MSIYDGPARRAAAQAARVEELEHENATMRGLIAALAHSADDDADGAPEIEALCQWAYHHHADWANDRPRPQLYAVD